MIISAAALRANYQALPGSFPTGSNRALGISREITVLYIWGAYEDDRVCLADCRPYVFRSRRNDGILPRSRCIAPVNGNSKFREGAQTPLQAVSGCRLSGAGKDPATATAFCAGPKEPSGKE